MATITSAGIGSGLDVNSIITQLMALERRPLNQLQSEKSGLQTQLTEYGRVAGALDSLRSAARTLTDSNTWSAAKASVSNTAALSASVSASATPGSYAVQVNRLAATQMLAAAAVATSASSIGQGTLHIELGAWDAGATAFTPKSGATALDITIGAGEDTLQGIKDKINATGDAGVRASIVTDNSGARLVLTSSTSGEVNGFRLTVADGDGIHNDASGLSRLAYDPAGGAGVATRTQAAADASAMINGLTVLSTTNQLANVIDGLTLNLSAITIAPVDVSVARDEAAMRKSVDGFVTAFNDANKLMRDLTKYDASTKVAGSLQGDRAAIGLLAQLRAALGQTSSASAVFDRASSIGLDVQSNGSITVQGSKLDAAIANNDEIRKFFTTAGSDNASNGLAVRLRALGDSVLGIDGPLSTRKQGLRDRIETNDDRRAALEDRMVRIEARLRAQYTALDRNMATLSGLQNYVNQQVTSWNRQRSN